MAVQPTMDAQFNRLWVDYHAHRSTYVAIIERGTDTFVDRGLMPFMEEEIYSKPERCRRLLSHFGKVDDEYDATNFIYCRCLEVW